MRVPADAAHTDPFALQILRSLDIATSDQRLGHDVFDAAGENHVRRPFYVSSHVTNAAGYGHFGVAAQQRRRDDARRGNKDQIEVDVVFLEETRFLRDPGKGLGHYAGGMHADEFIRRSSTMTAGGPPGRQHPQ